MARRIVVFLSSFTLVAVPLIVSGSLHTVSASAPSGSGRFARVCAMPQRTSVRCDADVVTTNSGAPLASTTPLTGSYGPAQFHTAYNLPCTIGGTTARTVCPTPTSFGGQTIAIVDAYQDPNIENDLGVYDLQYGLPPCTQANGCLQIADMCAVSKGKYRKYSCYTATQGWALEASMDVEIAHAVCQTCKILFVESYYADLTDMGSAENAAVQDGATEVSNSWSASEFSGETQYDANWNHPGVALLFAAGDSGYGAQYPSVAPTVLSVGGTTPTLNPDSTYGGETVWWSAGAGQGTGSGCSVYEPANSWQTSLSNWNSTGCGSFRAANDLAADADPSTGAAVYDSSGYNGTTGWYQVGGTSLATPLVASVVALAGGTAAYANADQVPYLRMSAANSHDVTVGSNGSCGTIMCTAGTGYNGPTGLGTPNGIAGF